MTTQITEDEMKKLFEYNESLKRVDKNEKTD